MSISLNEHQAHMVLGILADAQARVKDIEGGHKVAQNAKELNCMVTDLQSILGSPEAELEDAGVVTDPPACSTCMPTYNTCIAAAGGNPTKIAACQAAYQTCVRTCVG